METPSFTFRLHRVRVLRERAEEHTREEFARELKLRMRGEALLREGAHAVSEARRPPPQAGRRVSIAAAAARVSELEQMLRFQAPGTAAQPSASFAAQLSSATTAAAGAAPTASVSAAGAIGNPAHPSSLPAGTPYAAEITAAASKHVVDPALLACLVKQELRQQLDRFDGDVARALAAYNAGPGAVERFGGVPPYAETQEYVRRVQANAAEYRASGAAGTARTSALSASPSVHGIV